jgi:hypothetical protein
MLALRSEGYQTADACTHAPVCAQRHTDTADAPPAASNLIATTSTWC